MKFYVATRAIVDALNGYHLSSGSLIRTENSSWIKRFGSAFREIAAPDDPEILEDVVFVRSEGKVEPKRELVVETENPEQHADEEESEEDAEGDDTAESAEDLNTDSAAPVTRQRVKKKVARK